MASKQALPPPRFTTCQNTEPWKACDHPLDDKNWYIYNTQTGRYVKIGRVQLRGVNYWDRAIEEAEQRNRKLRGEC